MYPDDFKPEIELQAIDEGRLNKNEYRNRQADALKPKMKVKGEEASSESSEDEEFDWYSSDKHDRDSYFCFVNLRRRQLQPGEQAFYCYGNRSNKYLLLNYGICFPGNRYDSYSVWTNLKNFDKLDPFIPQMISYNVTDPSIQEIRLKKD